MLAAVALYHCEHTPAPWVPLGAASRDQAEILFAQAAGFVDRSRRLRSLFVVQRGYRRIKSLRTGGEGIKVYAAAVDTGDGVIPTLALVDELHRHPDLKLYRLWKGKLRKRRGQILTISTAGEPGSEFEEMRETIRGAAEVKERTGGFLFAETESLAYLEWMVQDRRLARDIGFVKDANPLAAITREDLEEKLASVTLDFGEDWLRLTSTSRPGRRRSRSRNRTGTAATTRTRSRGCADRCRRRLRLVAGHDSARPLPAGRREPSVFW
ncbi:MAG: phage terminase family protein [Acidimicrobiia bacterium]|nr:phage terminase family protein [Acidimicrobiia bacterium]